MERNPISAPRLLAPIALVAAGVIVIVVITLSFAETDEERRDRDARQGQQATTEGSDEKYYVVETGDSFSTIAEKTGIPQETLEQLNPDLDPQALAPGQRIRLR
jgi:LysM repeat protein